MRKALMILILFCSLFQIQASSGSGIQFNINDFVIRITWQDHEKLFWLDYRAFNNLIYIINENYSILSKIKKQIDINVYIIDGTIFLQSYENSDIEKKIKGAVSVTVNMLIKEIEGLLVKYLKLENIYNQECMVYVAFIPNYYLDPDNDNRVEVEMFLRKSEISIQSPMALQNNLQGYVFSIFYNKKLMYEELSKININTVIINQRNIYGMNDKWINAIDLTLFR